MDSNFSQKRLYLVSGIVVFAVVIFIAKLFYLQIIHGHSYEQLADRQYVTNTSNLFDRGSIYFTSKDGNQVSAATLKSGFKIAVSTITIGNPEVVYQKIGNILGLDHDSFIAQTSKKDPYVEIATNVPEDQASQVTAMKLSGVSVYRMNWRFYPAGDLASHVIGFMGFKGNDFSGRYGIERSYDQVLARTDQKLYVNFFAEIFTDISKPVKRSNEEIEGDVVTTIEPSVQKKFRTDVEWGKKKWSSESRWRNCYGS
jgi:cell division protein FtsI/penicillin-binding protein 2